YGFTGQRSDAATGLDHYGARYYDPLAGQFTSADTVVPGGGYDPWGLSRFAYVAGNPVARTDPTGHSLGPPPALNTHFEVAKLMPGGLPTLNPDNVSPAPGEVLPMPGAPRPIPELPQPTEPPKKGDPEQVAANPEEADSGANSEVVSVNSDQQSLSAL